MNKSLIFSISNALWRTLRKHICQSIYCQNTNCALHVVRLSNENRETSIAHSLTFALIHQLHSQHSLDWFGRVLNCCSGLHSAARNTNHIPGNSVSWSPLFTWRQMRRIEFDFRGQYGSCVRIRRIIIRKLPRLWYPFYDWRPWIFRLRSCRM